VGRDAWSLLCLQLLPAVDDRGPKFHRVTRDEDEALALGEEVTGLLLGLSVPVGVLKTQQSGCPIRLIRSDNIRLGVAFNANGVQVSSCVIASALETASFRCTVTDGKNP
jgi:hypothetical protein